MPQIELGAFTAPLKEQIPGLLDSERHQKNADAISRLLCQGLLTEKESDRARLRLIKKFRIEAAPEAQS